MHKISDIIINTQSKLSKLMASQNNMVKITHALLKIELFKKHAGHYRIIKFYQGILYLSVSTPALAMQIRHLSQMTLLTLQRDLPEIQFNAIQCKVSLNFSTIKETSVYEKNKPKALSRKTKTELAKLSEKIDSVELSAALKKLVT